jgi:rsbT antagonist protein RsbS
MTSQEVPRIPLQLSRGSVVASVQVELDDETLLRFRTDLLDFVHATGASSVLLDVSGVEIMDYDDFEQLVETLEMARVMGTRTVITGLQPAVASSLVDLGARAAGLVTALNLDHGFVCLAETQERTE